MGTFDHSRGEAFDFILVKSRPFASGGGGDLGQYIDGCINDDNHYKQIQESDGVS